MREVVRYRVAFYGSTPSYHPVLELHGWAELAQKLHACSRSGRWSEMAGLVTDEVLDEFVVAAPYDRLAEAVAARFGGKTDTLELLLPPEADAALSGALAEVAQVASPFAEQPAGW
jgi:hypothetical protein